MDVVDQRHARKLQPQRSEEADAVEDLERNVRVPDQAAPQRADRAREDAEPTAHPVDGQVVDLLPVARARVAAGHDRYAVSLRKPARHMPVQMRTGPTPLGMGPVSIREDEDVQGRCRPVAGSRSLPGWCQGVLEHGRVPTPNAVQTGPSRPGCTSPYIGSQVCASSASELAKSLQTRASTSRCLKYVVCWGFLSLWR